LDPVADQLGQPVLGNKIEHFVFAHHQIMRSVPNQKTRYARPQAASGSIEHRFRVTGFERPDSLQRLGKPHAADRLQQIIDRMQFESVHCVPIESGAKFTCGRLFVAQGTDPSQPGAILNPDSSLNTAQNRAAKNSVLHIFATGYGPLDKSGRAAVQVFTGGVPAEVQFSGPIPQFIGLCQINAVSGQVPLLVVAGNIASNGVTVWVQ